MENQNRDAEHRTPELAVPILWDTPDWAADAVAPQKPPFSASKTERIAAFLMYPLAFCYIQMLLAPLSAGAVWLCVFCSGFLAMTELLCRGRRRTWESWVWLGCLLVLIAFRVRLIVEAGRCGDDAPVHAVSPALSFFLLHAYAVYWVLCRSDTLLGGESSRLLPLDAMNGMIVFPFGGFFLRIRTAVSALAQLLRTRGGEKRSAAVRAGIAAAILAACALLVLSMRALSDADARFGAAVNLLTGNPLRPGRTRVKPGRGFEKMCGARGEGGQDGKVYCAGRHPALRRGHHQRREERGRCDHSGDDPGAGQMRH